MTVQELRDLIDRAATLPWTHDANSWHYQVMSADDNRVASKLWACDADLIVAAVNALPALLDIADAHKDHSCQREHWSWMDDPPPCPICDALDRLGETP